MRRRCPRTSDVWWADDACGNPEATLSWESRPHGMPRTLWQWRNRPPVALSSGSDNATLSTKSPPGLGLGGG